MGEQASFEERAAQLKCLIAESRHLAFFGGAGVSTESGIPDFRSKDGLYNQHDIRFEKYQPEYLLSHSCLENEPEVFYAFYRQKMNTAAIRPNITHIFLAELEKSGKRVSVITQNIDNLHEKAGSREVYAIHGTTYRNYCTVCGKEYPADAIFVSDERIPGCTACKKGRIRPDVTLYEEQLPKAFSQAAGVLHQADLMIVAGTSLTVYPAANLIREFYGAHLVVINRDETQADRYADLVFHEEMGKVIAAVQAGL